MNLAKVLGRVVASRKEESHRGAEAPDAGRRRA